MHGPFAPVLVNRDQPKQAEGNTASTIRKKMGRVFDMTSKDHSAALQ